VKRSEQTRVIGIEVDKESYDIRRKGTGGNRIECNG